MFVIGAPPGEEMAVNDGENRPRRAERRNRERVVIRIRTYSCVLPLLPFFVVSWREDFWLFVGIFQTRFRMGEAESCGGSKQISVCLFKY